MLDRWKFGRGDQLEIMFGLIPKAKLGEIF